MHALYKEKPQKKYQTMSINDIYNQTVEKPLFCIKQDRGSLHIAGKRRELY